MESKIKALEAFALANYENGGHWVYETHESDDYQKRLDAVGGDLEKAKSELKKYWILIEQVSSDIRGS